MNHPRTVQEKPMADASTGSAPPPAPRTVLSPAPDPDNGWAVLAHDRRAWMAIGIIAGGAALIGAALGAGLHRSPLVPAVLFAAMTVSFARGAWGWMRGRSRRARLREGLLAHVEEYGGGVYGTGAAITLLVLSAASLRAEWAQAAGGLDFFRGMTLDWWIGFSGESIRNAVQAGMWPIHWYTEHGLVAALAVGAAAWAGDALADAWRRREPVENDAPVAIEGRSTQFAG
jgi:hypothetical protein